MPPPAPSPPPPPAAAESRPRTNGQPAPGWNFLNRMRASGTRAAVTMRRAIRTNRKITFRDYTPGDPRRRPPKRTPRENAVNARRFFSRMSPEGRVRSRIEAPSLSLGFSIPVSSLAAATVRALAAKLRPVILILRFQLHPSAPALNIYPRVDF